MNNSPSVNAIPKSLLGVGAEAEGDLYATEAPSHRNQDKSQRLRLSSKDQWLLSLEIALQIYFSHTKSNEISYDQFCELAPKLNLERPPASLVLPTQLPVDEEELTEDKNVSLTLLDTSNRLWHDFICVTTPFLYTWNDDDKQDNHDWTLKRITLKNGTPRPHELKRLLHKAHSSGISREMSNKIVAFFLARTKSGNEEEQPHESAKENHDSLVAKASTTHHHQPQKKGVSSLKELEDRIRAKAQSRQRHLDEAERNKPQIQQDEKVIVADALVSHARQVLRQRHNTGLRRVGGNNRFRTKANASSSASSPTSLSALTNNQHCTTTTCRISFQSVVDALPTFTQQQLSSAIQQLAEQCPEWISVSGDSSSMSCSSTSPIKKDTVMIPKKAIITVETANYKKMRAQLLGIEATTTTASSSSSSSSLVAEDRSPMRRRLGPVVVLPERTPPHPTGVVPAVTVSGSKRLSSDVVTGTLKGGKRVREGL